MAEVERPTAEQLQQACDQALAHFKKHRDTREGKAFYANRNSKCYLLFAAGYQARGGGYRARVHDRELGLLPAQHEYVGNTVQFDRRLRQHNGELPDGAKRNRPFVCAPVLCVEGFEGGQTNGDRASLKLQRQRARTMSLLFENLWEGMFGRPLILKNVGDLSAKTWLHDLRDDRVPVVWRPESSAIAGAFHHQRRLVRLAQLAMLLTHPVWGARRSWRVWCYHARWRDLFREAWTFVYQTHRFSWTRPWTDARAADAVPLPLYAPQLCVVGDSEAEALLLPGALEGWQAPAPVLDEDVDALEVADELVFQAHEAQLSAWDAPPPAQSAWDYVAPTQSAWGAHDAAPQAAWESAAPTQLAYDAPQPMASAYDAPQPMASAWDSPPPSPVHSIKHKRVGRMRSRKAGKGLSGVT